jgi:hypothetical protein
MPTYNLKQTVLQGETTSVGVNNYQGGNLLDQNNRQIGTFTIVTRDFGTVTDSPAENLNTGMLELQLFFQARGQGQGQGGSIQETMVLQGAPEFAQPPSTAPMGPPGTVFPPREVTRAHGSVSAATPQFAQFIGHQWTISPAQNGLLQLVIV